MRPPPGRLGFLPPYEPLRRLPAPFDPWEEIAADLPVRRLVGRIRPDLEALPFLDPESLEDGPEIERAMLILSHFAGAYVHDTDPPRLSLPPPVARPLATAARRLSRPPIGAHASLAMHNWRRIDPERPVAVENLATLVRAHGSTDEIWFFTIAIAIEAVGAGIPALVADAETAAAREDGATVGRALVRLGEVIRAVTALTERTREGCDPGVFYRRVRPPFSAWPAPGVTYQGADYPEPLVLAGGSAAQSPLVQLFDAVLSVRHPPLGRSLCLEMRRYMAPAHRAFVTEVEAAGAIRRFIEDSGDGWLRGKFEAALANLLELRQVHWRLVSDYITRQAAPGARARGTGGTDYGRFLTSTIRGVEQTLTAPRR